MLPSIPLPTLPTSLPTSLPSLPTAKTGNEVVKAGANMVS